MIKDLILKNRSYRKFSKLNINDQTLKEFIDLARNSSSAGNLQPLKYIFSCKDEKNNLIFPHLAWAGYLKDWNGPLEEERPSAYIIILGDTRIGKSFGYDCGIAAQSILLGAVERGLGGCMIASIDKEGLRKDLQIASCYEILLVIAIGKPKEEIVLEDINSDGSIKYWRDNNDKHHVPKRKLKDIIIDM